MQSYAAHGQFEDLSSIIGIGNDDLSMIGETESDDRNPELNDLDINDGEEVDKEKYQDSKYGYSGGESFDNPPNSKLSEEPLEYFGYSYFSKSSNSFFAQTNIPVPPGYLIGPNDIINVILYGNKNNRYRLEVSREGEIFFPEIGPITIAGLTFDSVRKLIDEIISTQFIGTQVSLTLGSLRTIDVFVLGAANKPGMYSVSALSNITNAIFQSGGIDTYGSLRNIKLKRDGKTEVQFDLYDLFLNGDTSNDRRLMQGDVIFIEPIGKTAAVKGEVNRPAIYELKDDETLDDLLNFAGNFKPKASKSNIELTRMNQSRNSYDLVKLDLESLSKFNLNNGDMISIYPINDKMQNAVLVSGHTLQPGFYPWTEGMRILDLFQNADDLLEMTDLNYLLIKRKNKMNQSYSFIQVDLEDAFRDSSSSQNKRLFDKDEILLLPSLLKPSLITTKLIFEQEREEGSNTSFIEEEWTSLTYLRKSLQKKSSREVDEAQSQVMENQYSQHETTQRETYYEYSIYDYCIVPKHLVAKLNEENEKVITNQIQEETTDLSKEITNECRKQLIEPVISVINRDNANNKLKFVSVFGGVHFPGRYPYTEDMTLSAAIDAAGGTLDGIFAPEIEVNRLDNAGNKFISKESFTSLDEANEVKLSEMDIITVKKMSSEVRTVEIKGEVYFPGIYPISENQSLSELVARAGGATNYADLDAAIFLRESIREQEIKRLETAKADLQKNIILTSQSGDIGQEQLNSRQVKQLTDLLDQTPGELESLGRLVINLEEIILGQNQDILLENGDTLHIPKNKQSISVIGEVFVETTHVYDDQFNISEYIELSGGLTEFADQSSIYIIKSNGNIVSPSQISSGFFRSSSAQLRSGDTIVVPLKVNSFNQLRAATEITQIVYQMAIAAAAVNSF